MRNITLAQMGLIQTSPGGPKFQGQSLKEQQISMNPCLIPTRWALPRRPGLKVILPWVCKSLKAWPISVNLFCWLSFCHWVSLRASCTFLSWQYGIWTSASLSKRMAPLKQVRWQEGGWVIPPHPRIKLRCRYRRGEPLQASGGSNSELRAAEHHASGRKTKMDLVPPLPVYLLSCEMTWLPLRWSWHSSLRGLAYRFHLVLQTRSHPCNLWFRFNIELRLRATSSPHPICRFMVHQNHIKLGVRLDITSQWQLHTYASCIWTAKR